MGRENQWKNNWYFLSKAQIAHQCFFQEASYRGNVAMATTDGRIVTLLLSNIRHCLTSGTK